MKEVKYKKSDFKKISWEEYGQVLERLYKKVDKYLRNKKVKIDAIVPILRGGAFPGAFFSYKLRILRIMPVQYKYLFEGGFKLRQLMPIRKPNFKLSKKPIFLLVENNHCYGTTAIKVANDLKKKFPSCKIIYAAAWVDYSNRKNKVFDVSFYGKLTNETAGLSKKEAEKKGIENFMSLFPWEDINEEFAAVSSKEFKYN